jgi:hypothetical protein
MTFDRVQLSYRLGPLRRRVCEQHDRIDIDELGPPDCLLTASGAALVGSDHYRVLRGGPTDSHAVGLSQRVRDCGLPMADLGDQTGGGSMRSIVSIRSMDRSNEAILPTPVLSAHAARYASAKSIRSIS